MATITPPSPETVASCVAHAARVGPRLGDLIARYCTPSLPNDPEVSRTLMEAGMAIIPGIRLEDAVETALWAHNATPEVFACYVRQVYAEGRVYRRAQAA